MAFALMLWWGVAGAACPDPAPALASAENDALSFFLADAQKSLGQVVRDLACGDPIDPEVAARYWQTQGMIWRFQEDPRAAEAFAASKKNGSTRWLDDWGAKAKAAWEDAAPSNAAPVTLTFRGLQKNQSVYLDGVPAEGNIAVGYHLLQVTRADGTVRFAKAVQALEGSPLSVRLPEDTQAPPPVSPEPVSPEPVEPEPAPEPAEAEPAPEPVAPEPEPAPEPVAPEPVKPEPTEPEPAKPQPMGPKPVADGEWAAPFTGRPKSLVDAQGRALNWRKDTLMLASRTEAGRQAQKQLRRNTWAQMGTTAVCLGAGYTSYVYGWDAFVGGNQSSSTSLGLTGAFGAVSVGALAIEGLLLKQRSGHRKRIRDAAMEEAEANGG